MTTDWSSPMWEREKVRRFWDPGPKLLLAIRDYQRHLENTLINRLLRKWIVLRYRFWSVVTGAEIDLHCSIGGGLLIPHPNGIVIHPEAVIGINCLIFQQVTLAGRVILEDHVDIGAGAKLLGPITIGANTKIGANAVVRSDIPPGSTAVGVPARTIAKDAHRL